MKIEIDTKEDLHNLKHIIQFLSVISSNISRNNYYEEQSAPSLFSDTSASQSSQASSAPGLFNMFDSPSQSTQSSPSDSFSIVSDANEQKKDSTNKGDFLDSLQVY